MSTFRMVADRAVGEGHSCYTVDAEFQYGKILEVCGTVYLKLAKKIHFIVFFFFYQYPNWNKEDRFSLKPHLTLKLAHTGPLGNACELNHR